MPIYALGEISPRLPESGNFWVAPDAQVMGNIVLLENASIWFAAVLRGDNETITIGENSNVQTARYCIPLEACRCGWAKT